MEVHVAHTILSDGQCKVSRDKSDGPRHAKPNTRLTPCFISCLESTLEHILKRIPCVTYDTRRTPTRLTARGSPTATSTGNDREVPRERTAAGERPQDKYPAGPLFDGGGRASANHPESRQRPRSPRAHPTKPTRRGERKFKLRCNRPRAGATWPENRG